MPLADSLVKICDAAMGDPGMRKLKDALADRGFNSEECHRLVHAIDELPSSRYDVKRLKELFDARDPELTAEYRLERFLLLNSAKRVAGLVSSLPVAESVKELYREEFSFFADSDVRYLKMFQVEGYRFAEMCKVVSLRRFPAGQLHWENSGVLRSSLLHVPRLHAPRFLSFVVRKLRGTRPCFKGHLNGRRKNCLMLLESEQNAAYYRIAKSMELQPEILGYVATSWFHSPVTFRVTPHLQWLNSIFLENGGFIVDMGVESPDCGVLVGSRERRQRWESGEFKPRNAMVIWPRREMIGWATRHPEFAESVEPYSSAVAVGAD